MPSVRRTDNHHAVDRDTAPARIANPCDRRRQDSTIAGCDGTQHPAAVGGQPVAPIHDFVCGGVHVLDPAVPVDQQGGAAQAVEHIDHQTQSIRHTIRVSDAHPPSASRPILEIDCHRTYLYAPVRGRPPSRRANRSRDRRLDGLIRYGRVCHRMNG
ncbi:hypothetical protein NSERUTF1_2294 [Nocardia seriolae]|nr:hypothetical protein NSERUTF1_2294 [Nocardia seriolae]